MEEKLIDLIGRHGLLPHPPHAPSLLHPTELPTVILQSFSTDSLWQLRHLAPAIPRVRLIESSLDAAAIVPMLPAIAAYAQAIGPAHGSIDATLVAAAHEHGLAIHPYTVNDQPTMRALIAAGTDGIFTDDPALLLAVARSS